LSLHKPFFFIKESLEKDCYILYHNCDGNIDFVSNEELDEHTHQLITLAIEEGKRRKAEEIKTALYIERK